MLKDNIVTIDWDDEILAKTVLTHDGQRKDRAANPDAKSAGGKKAIPAKPAAKAA